MGRSTTGILLFALSAVAACSEDVSPVAPSVDLQRAFTEAWQQRAHTPGTDGEFLAIHAEVPEFAGYYFDEARTPVVLVTDMRAASRASKAFQARLAGRGIKSKPPLTKIAAWNAADLARWRDALLPALAVDGVVFVDLDERANRVRIGVSDNAARGPIMQLASGMEVPRSAVLISDAAPYRPFTLLTDQIRPIPGGVRLSRSSGPICTYGVGVLWADYALNPTYLSSAHCSKIMGQTDNGIYNQANSCGIGCLSQMVGGELYDPPFFTGAGCPTGRRCRWSDAAVGVYEISTATPAFGRIARTTFREPVLGSKLIDSANPYLQIGADFPYPMFQEPVHKMGQSTGWTYGFPSQSCVAVNMASTDITLFCQYVVTAGAQEGDSGAPAFHYSPLSDAVVFVGLVWGGNNTSFVMSSLENIELDLGNVTVF